MLKDLTIPNCHGLRMPKSRDMPILKATSGPFCSRFDPHKTNRRIKPPTDRSVDIEGRGCKAVSGNCCQKGQSSSGTTRRRTLFADQSETFKQGGRSTLFAHDIVMR